MASRIYAIEWSSRKRPPISKMVNFGIYQVQLRGPGNQVIHASFIVYGICFLVI